MRKNDDLISRKAVLDALEKVVELFPWRVPGNRDSYDRYNEAWNDAIGRAEIEIEKLPSAQEKRHEERTETHACDCINCSEIPNNSDAISRQAAMEEISKQQTYKMFEGEDTLYLDANDVGSVLASLPSAQPDLDEVYAHAETEAEARFHAQQRWIPCSERLPEENGQYLITVKYVHVDGYDDIYAEHGEWTDGKWDMFCFGHCGKVENIIAWMPLPEPYAERRTDEAR